VPSLAPLPASATLPLRRSAREIEADVLLASGPNGTLLVSIPTLTGSVLALLGGDGKPRPGWPIARQDSCSLLLPLEDGSVVVVCDPPGFETPQDVRAFAFRAGGHPPAGWPVELGSDLSFTGRMVGDDLMLAAGLYGPQVSMRVVSPDGKIRQGAEIAMECCYAWAVAPDGIAYSSGAAPEPPYDSHVTAVDLDGERPGWPVEFDGRTSTPAFTPDGRIVVTVGPPDGGSSRVLMFGRAGKDTATTSWDLPLKVVQPLGGGDVDCGPSWSPRAPIIGDDGTIFVWSEIDRTVFALDPSPAIRPGWPFEPSRPLQQFSYEDPRAELSCSSLASPAVGPDSTLYLPLQARNQTVGGSLVAVGRDGRVRPGWPVELKRPGSEFWSVVVGSDGTVHALAVEREPGGASSATILAIAPDSTVLWTTTIIDP
jgi:WD40 repeat protein